MTQYQSLTVYKLHKLMYCMDTEADKLLLNQTQISYNEFMVFLALRDNPHFTQEEIGSWAQFNKSTVSKLVDKLVTKKLLERTENAVDRRQKDLLITKLGEIEINKAQEITENLSNMVFDSLTTTDHNAFDTSLKTLLSTGLPKMYESLKK